MSHLIYIADDESSIRELLKDFLESDGYEVEAFENGNDLLEAFANKKSDLVILDIMMPGKDGLTCCRELRESTDVPIILLTAKDSELDYVQGITIGSDDYLTKPFRPTVLLMRVKSLLRRVEMSQNSKIEKKDLMYGDIRFSAEENALYCNKQIVRMSQTELRMLAYMLENPKKAYSREELLDKIWGFNEEVETRVTDETLRRIRKKLTQANSSVMIETVWGFGYKLQLAEESK